MGGGCAAGRLSVCLSLFFDEVCVALCMAFLSWKRRRDLGNEGGQLWWLLCLFGREACVRRA